MRGFAGLYSQLLLDLKKLVLPSITLLAPSLQCMGQRSLPRHLKDHPCYLITVSWSFALMRTICGSRPACTCRCCSSGTLLEACRPCRRSRLRLVFTLLSRRVVALLVAVLSATVVGRLGDIHLGLSGLVELVSVTSCRFSLRAHARLLSTSVLLAIVHARGRTSCCKRRIALP